MTLEALDAAIRELLLLGAPYRVVVVDNDSQDGSEETLRAGVAMRQAQQPGYENVEVLQSGQNGGFGAGNNVGIRHALNHGEAPEYFYVLNSDAFPETDAITALVRFLDTNADVGIVGSYAHGSDGEPHCTAFRFPSIQSEFEDAMNLGIVTRLLGDYVVPIGVPNQTIEVDWIAGASLMVRRSVLEEVGLFDETFFLYFEETDLCRRVRNAGHRIYYVRESSVVHIGSVSTGKAGWKRMPGYWFDSRRHYFLKNHGRRYLMGATAARVVGSTLWQVRRRIQRKPDPDPEGALTDLVGHALKHLPPRSLNRAP